MKIGEEWVTLDRSRGGGGRRRERLRWSETNGP